MLFLSIIVPTYNSDNNIVPLIRSLNRLTKNKHIEVLYIDDGSTDETVHLLNSKIENPERTKVIRLSHGGVSKARNTGIRYAKGKYISFIDSDDNIIFKKYLKIMEKYLKNEKYDIINVSEQIKNCHNHIEITEEEQKKKLVAAMVGIDNAFDKYEYLQMPWSKFFRTELLRKENILFDKKLKIGEDGFFNCDAIFKAKKIFFLKEQIYIYNYNQGSAMHKKVDYDFVIDNTYREKIINKLYKERKISIDVRNYYIIQIILSNYVRFFSTEIKNKQYREIEKYQRQILRKFLKNKNIQENLTSHQLIMIYVISVFKVPLNLRIIRILTKLGMILKK